MPIDTTHTQVDDGAIDNRVIRFWQAYSTDVGDYDHDILQKNGNNIKGVMLFAGLFSAVSATFLVATQNNLQPNPADTTNALLMMLVRANNNSAFAGQDINLPVWNGPSSVAVYSQALGYAALSASLLAAMGAVLGKQWLSNYTRLRSGQLRERCRRRQLELEGLKAWRFEMVISALPALIQLALLLFSIALAMSLWEVNRAVGAVLIASTAIGVSIYLFMTVASLFFTTCPFQTPVSSFIRAIVGGVMKSAEEVTEYWAWCTDKRRQLKRPIISRGNVLVASIGGALFYPLLAAMLVTRQVLSAVLIPLVVLATWIRGERGVIFEAWTCSYRSACHFRMLKSRIHTSTCWVRDSARRARDYIRHAYLEPELDSVTLDPHAIAWILGTSTNPDNFMAAAELVPDVAWPENLDISLPQEHLRIFIGSLPEKSDGRGLRLGKALIVMLYQLSKDVSTHVWREALRHVTKVSKMLSSDGNSDTLFILIIVAKFLHLKLGSLYDGIELPGNCEVSQPLLSWFLQPLEVLLLSERSRQLHFLPEANRVFLKLEWPEESKLEEPQVLQYLRTFEIYFNSVLGAHIEKMGYPIKQSRQDLGESHVDFIKRILEKLIQIDLSELPEVHQHLIVPLAVLSRLASVSYMQRPFRKFGISLWMTKAFKEAVALGKARESGESILLFASCVMKLATVTDAFNLTDSGVQVEVPMTDGDVHVQTSMPPVHMDSRSLLAYLLNNERPQTPEEVVYALQIMLANMGELHELASDPQFVEYILFVTGPGQAYSIRDMGEKVLVAASKYLIVACDTRSLADLATQCDLVRFLRRGILKDDPPTILVDLLRRNHENFNAGLLKLLAPVLSDPFNTLLTKLHNEPNMIPEGDLRDLEITLVLSNTMGRKRLLYDHLDHCIGQMPLKDYKDAMALPLVVIVGWLLRRDGPLSAVPDQRIWRSFLRSSFEELLFPAWGDADKLEENPQMLRLLLNCTTRWLSTLAKPGKNSGAQSGLQPSPSTLQRLDVALDQLMSASQRLSPDIKRALQKLSGEIKQYLPEEEQRM